MTRSTFVLVALCVLVPASALRGDAPATDPTLLEGFRRPPLAARPRALWTWTNGNTDLAEITHELEEAKAKGMGGFDIFSGIATYRKTLSLPPKLNLHGHRVVLRLGRVETTARVVVNGREGGTLWTPPFVLDVTRLLRTGRNELRIEVANLWPDRSIGDARLPGTTRGTHTNIEWLPNAWSIPMAELPNDKYGLLPSGLFGPVELAFE